MTKIKTWKENLYLKQDIYTSLSKAPVIKRVSWQCYKSQISGITAWIVQWLSSEHKGALKGERVAEFSYFMDDALKRNAFDEIKKLFILMQSSGADLVSPFESLVEINRLMEILSLISFKYHVEINGVVEQPVGVYGGASLLMASTCDNIWCESPLDIHITAR